MFCGDFYIVKQKEFVLRQAILCNHTESVVNLFAVFHWDLRDLFFFFLPECQSYGA